jgi:simple sugar transport system ATP-binding protein
LTKFNIRAADIYVRARTLSGGNQQKVVLARAMRDGAPILIAYQPTRGLDIGATEELLERLRGAANGGAAVLLISSNLEEILRVADRIIVLYRGRMMGEVGGGDVSLDKIGGWMTGTEVA